MLMNNTADNSLREPDVFGSDRGGGDGSGFRNSIKRKQDPK